MSEVKNEITEPVVDSGSITYANDVIAKIAALAANEVDGIIGMTGGSIQDMLGMKNLTKGLKVTLDEEDVTVELHIIVQYGVKIHEVCVEVQNAIKKAIESMTGLNVVSINVNVNGIKLPEEEKEPVDEAKPKKKEKGSEKE